MSEFRIALSDLDYGAEEEAAVLRVLKSKWLSMGPETNAFQKEFAAFTGARHSLALANGTTALHLAFLALGLKSGDEIIQPAVNFVAAANLCCSLGITPVFGDILSLDEPTLDPVEIERCFTPRTKAVVVMHYGGYPCRMAEILKLCRKHKLGLVEDACHGVGAEYHDAQQREPHGKRVGNLGDIACFSFFSNKNLAVGEGGMVTTNNDELADKIRQLRSHGMSTLTWDRHRGHAATYDVLVHGYNCRLDDLRSALGRTQLAKLECNNKRRLELTMRYWDRLAPLEEHGWVLPYKHHLEVRGQKTESSRRQATAAHLLAVVAPTPAMRWRCAEALKAAGIQSSLHYPYIPEFSAFRMQQPPLELSKSQLFCRNVITLPLHPNLKLDEIDSVIDCLLTAVSQS